MFSRIFYRFRVSKRHPKKIYADYATLTPIRGKVLSLMSKVYRDFDKNPSALYGSAVLAKKRLETCRSEVAKLLSGQSQNSVHSDEMFFTGSGTESNNMAIQGIIDSWYETHKDAPHIVTTVIEHPAVKKVIEDLVQKGKATASFVPITEEGLVDLGELKKVFEVHTNIALVSVMLVNNEIGTIQPIREVARMVRAYRKKENGAYPYFHTDACQAPCYLDMQIDKMGVDLLTLDGGKIYGPRGVGCLYVRRGVHLTSVYKGGGQENGLRPGTENLPGIAGFAAALKEVFSEREKETKRIRKMQQYIFEHLPKSIFINGSTDPEKRIANNINICIPGIDSEFAVFQADVAGVEISAVTACQNTQEESRSYVVDALQKQCGASSLRISLGRGTTWGEVKKIVRVIQTVAKAS